MEHQDKGGPDGPQRVWQSIQQQEEGGMEMRLTTDELCVKARFRERDNVGPEFEISVPVAFLKPATFWTEHRGSLRR